MLYILFVICCINCMLLVKFEVSLSVNFEHALNEVPYELLLEFAAKSSRIRYEVVAKFPLNFPNRKCTSEMCLGISR